MLSLVGGLLVQGALVGAVNDLYSNRPAAPTRALYDRTRERLGTLLGASLVYGFGVVLGIVLLIVPGLIAIARWSLIVPLIVIERRGWREAFSRSNQLVTGRTGRVLVLVVIANAHHRDRLARDLGAVQLPPELLHRVGRQRTWPARSPSRTRRWC